MEVEAPALTVRLWWAMWGKKGRPAGAVFAVLAKQRSARVSAERQPEPRLVGASQCAINRSPGGQAEWARFSDCFLLGARGEPETESGGTATRPGATPGHKEGDILDVTCYYAAHQRRHGL